MPARVIAWSVSGDDVIKPSVEPDPFAISRVGILLPRALAARIVTQSGLFSVHPTPSEPWTEPLARPEDSFDVPGEMRDWFEQRLFYLGVDSQRIMGGLDGLGQRLAWQYATRFGLGAVR